MIISIKLPLNNRPILRPPHLRDTLVLPSRHTISRRRSELDPECLEAVFRAPKLDGRLAKSIITTIIPGGE